MGQMLNNIKEGGVSLIGHEQPFTHDHFRKSFIRRNKNPVINEKAHTLRALQSTLKVRRKVSWQMAQVFYLLSRHDITRRHTDTEQPPCWNHVLYNHVFAN